MRKPCILLAAVATSLVTPPVGAHELWFHLEPGADSAVVRLTFGDTPNLNEAERVAEIAHAKVWAGGKSLEVKRLPDGLEARLPHGGAAVVNALPPLKVVQLLGNACLSPTTLAPKDPFRSRGPRWILFVFSRLRRAAPGDLQRPCGCAWSNSGRMVRTVSRRDDSVDIFQRGRFLFPRQPAEHPHYQRADYIVPRAGSLSRIVHKDHHSFNYAARAA